MTIRHAQKKDIPKIEDLLLQVGQVHHLGRPDLFRKGAKKYSQLQLEQLLADKDRPILVAVNDADAVLGYAFCILQKKEGDSVLQDVLTLYIDDLCVDETCRGQSVGSSLYQAVLGLAKSLGCYNVTLNVWNCNPGALRFYERCGLQIQKIGMEKILE